MNSILFALLLAIQQPPAELDLVLQRATDYVTKYEEELGNLIGTEDYVQKVAYLGSGTRYGMIQKREERRTSSDFLIIQVGRIWSALRKVNQVDGARIKESDVHFETSFDDSPASNMRRYNSMKADSTKYNIGNVLREINLPTFPLQLLRRSEVSRFAFEKTGTSKINGVQTWEVRFQELKGWTLVHGDDGELFSHGILWIEPETGRVLRTEFSVETTFQKQPIKARIVVDYVQGKRVNMLVPALMVERYETTISTIDCRADYSNFRQFEVDVKFDLGPVKPPGPEEN